MRRSPVSSQGGDMPRQSRGDVVVKHKPSSPIGPKTYRLPFQPDGQSILASCREGVKQGLSHPNEMLGGDAEFDCERIAAARRERFGLRHRPGTVQS